VLDILPLKASNRKGQPKVSHWEGLSLSQYVKEDVIEVEISATYWNNRAFVEVCTKTGNFPEVIEDVGKILQIFF
jgi:hypothetical protein